jgi:hypothetical protein
MNTAESEKYKVEHIVQNGRDDIYRITNKIDGEITYERFPRSMGQTCESVLCYLD